MKYLKIALLLLIITAVSCNQSEIDRLENENQILLNEANAKDSLMIFMLDAFNEIEVNLMEVTDRQGTINIRTGLENDKSLNSRERILEDIAYINTLMIENNEKLDEFQNQLDKAKKMQKSTSGELSSALKQIEQMESLIVKLKQQNNQKALEVDALKEELISMNFEMEKISLAFAKKSQFADKKQDELNTAYYTIGTFKELKNDKILTRHGSFIGIGGAKVLVENFNKESFVEIDITEVQEILLNDNNVSLATYHPDSSYSFVYVDEKIEKLQIIDPAEFWSVSKFLVLVKK